MYSLFFAFLLEFVFSPFSSSFSSHAHTCRLFAYPSLFCSTIPTLYHSMAHCVCQSLTCSSLKYIWTLFFRLSLPFHFFPDHSSHVWQVINLPLELQDQLSKAGASRCKTGIVICVLCGIIGLLIKMNLSNQTKRKTERRITPLPLPIPPSSLSTYSPVATSFVT